MCCLLSCQHYTSQTFSTTQSFLQKFSGDSPAVGCIKDGQGEEYRAQNVHEFLYCYIMTHLNFASVNLANKVALSPNSMFYSKDYLLCFLLMGRGGQWLLPLPMFLGPITGCGVYRFSLCLCWFPPNTQGILVLLQVVLWLVTAATHDKSCRKL